MNNCLARSMRNCIKLLLTVLLVLLVYSLMAISHAQETNLSTITDKAGIVTTLKNLSTIYKARGSWVRPLSGRGADPPQKVQQHLTFTLSFENIDRKDSESISFSEIKEIKFSWFPDDPERVKVININKKDGSIITIGRDSHITGTLDEFDSSKVLKRHLDFSSCWFSLRGEPELFLEEFVGQKSNEADKTKDIHIPFHEVSRIVFK